MRYLGRNDVSGVPAGTTDSAPAIGGTTFIHGQRPSWVADVARLSMVDRMTTVLATWVSLTVRATCPMDSAVQPPRWRASGGVSRGTLTPVGVGWRRLRLANSRCHVWRDRTAMEMRASCLALVRPGRRGHLDGSRLGARAEMVQAPAEHLPKSMPVRSTYVHGRSPVATAPAASADERQIRDQIEVTERLGFAVNDQLRTACGHAVQVRAQGRRPDPKRRLVRDGAPRRRDIPSEDIPSTKRRRPVPQGERWVTQPYVASLAATWPRSRRVPQRGRAGAGRIDAVFNDSRARRRGRP